MKQLINYCKNCTIERIKDVECNIAGLIKVSNNYCVNIEIYNLPHECMEQVENNSESIMYLKTLDYCVTVIGYWIIEEGSQLVDLESGAAVFSYILEAKRSLWNYQYCMETKFDDFTFRVTEGAELIGLTPYGDLVQKQSELHIATEIQQINESSGFSCFTAPQIRHKGMDKWLAVQHGLCFSKNQKLSILEIDEKIKSIILLLEVLCGELITILNIKVRQGKEIYEYLGAPWKTKELLNAFQRTDKGTWYNVRERLFKLSDFDNDSIGVVSVFDNLFMEDRVAFGAYQQLLMDEELQIFTVNNFLKVMQMVEGLERQKDRKKIHNEFRKKRESILEKTDNDDVRAFIKDYCNDNGETFKECMNKITNNCVELLSGESTQSCEELIKRIIKDRNTYTHASHKDEPIFSQVELKEITYCYKAFFRIEVLKQLGLCEELIRKRFSYDGVFNEYYKKIFGKSIKKCVQIVETKMDF